MINKYYNNYKDNSQKNKYDIICNNENIFFRYNSNSCWIDCFLFKLNNIIYDKFPDKDLSSLKLEKMLHFFKRYMQNK